MSMIRSVVEGHGGAVREVGREKRGATFEMYLPIADTADVTSLANAADVGDGAGLPEVTAIGSVQDA